MSTVIKFFEGDLGDIESYFRCDLSQASSPLQQWDCESECWSSTQYQCADARHSTSGMISLCHSLMAGWCEVPEDEFTCEHTEIETFGYTVADANCEDFSEAVERIANWYDDIDQWADGHGSDDLHSAVQSAISDIDQPEDGGLRDLQSYADAICQAVAKAMGHGNYAVSAAVGIRLTIAEIENPE